jgi:hypothetical protein
MDSQRELLKIIETNRAICLAFGLSDRWKKNAEQKSENGNNHQKLDEREPSVKNAIS